MNNVRFLGVIVVFWVAVFNPLKSLGNMSHHISSRLLSGELSLYYLVFVIFLSRFGRKQ